MCQVCGLGGGVCQVCGLGVGVCQVWFNNIQVRTCD